MRWHAHCRLWHSDCACLCCSAVRHCWHCSHLTIVVVSVMVIVDSDCGCLLHCSFALSLSLCRLNKQEQFNKRFCSCHHTVIVLACGPSLAVELPFLLLFVRFFFLTKSLLLCFFFVFCFVLIFGGKKSFPVVAFWIQLFFKKKFGLPQVACIVDLNFFLKKNHFSSVSTVFFNFTSICSHVLFCVVVVVVVVVLFRFWCSFTFFGV